MLLQAGNGRAIPMPTAQGEIIDANDPRRGRRRNRSLMDKATEGRGTQPQVKPRDKACTAFTTYGKGDCTRHILGACSPPGIRLQEVR